MKVCFQFFFGSTHKKRWELLLSLLVFLKKIFDILQIGNKRRLLLRGSFCIVNCFICKEIHVLDAAEIEPDYPRSQPATQYEAKDGPDIISTVPVKSTTFGPERN